MTGYGLLGKLQGKWRRKGTVVKRIKSNNTINMVVSDLRLVPMGYAGAANWEVMGVEEEFSRGWLRGLWIELIGGSFYFGSFMFGLIQFERGNAPTTWLCGVWN